MAYATELIAQEYFRYKRTVQAMEAEVQQLPQGNLTYRNRKGRRYCYRQFQDDQKKRHNEYIAKGNVAQVEQSIQRRQALQEDIRILKAKIQQMEQTYPQLKSFSQTVQPRDSFRKPEKPYLTAKGDYVRSKSEVIIANELYNHQISYEYEKPLIVNGFSKPLLPDFTICTPSGKIVFWEHCGLMDHEEYRSRWNWKKQIYEQNDISEWKQNLIATYETPENTLSMEMVQQHIDYLLRS